MDLFREADKQPYWLILVEDHTTAPAKDQENRKRVSEKEHTKEPVISF